MDKSLTYLLLDVLTLAGPLALSFDRRVAFYRQLPRVLAAMAIAGGVFVAWDVAFTRAGVWSFNEAYVTGIWMLGLPVEEWAFFVVVPYACVFIYACVLAYGKWPPGADRGRLPMVLLGAGLLFVAAVHHHRAYTFWACGGAGLFCILVIALRRFWPFFRADAFLLAWSICLVPFLAVNGLLTALPVVIYNNAENTGIRIGTIPAEDTAYGMLLVLACALPLRYTHDAKGK